jgi:membrane protein YdbS with pleckstrin-like domain
METHGPRDEHFTDEAWQARQRYWRRKLGRLRLGVEPIEDQLARYRRVTWMLTAVPLIIGLMFLGLFAAFQRPDVGLVLAAVLLLPIVAIAWIEHGLLLLRAARYTRERAEYERRQATSGRT